MKTYKADIKKFGQIVTGYTLRISDKIDAEAEKIYESTRGKISTLGYTSMMDAATQVLMTKSAKLARGCSYEVVVHSEGIGYRSGKWCKNEVVLHVFVDAETSERAKVTAVTAERSSLGVRDARPDKVKTHGYVSRREACKSFFGMECPIRLPLVLDLRKRCEAQSRKWVDVLDTMADFAI